MFIGLHSSNIYILFEHERRWSCDKGRYILALMAVKDVKNVAFYYIIRQSLIRAFQPYAQHPIRHYGH